MIEAGIPAPSTAGFELADTSGAVIAEGELAWEEYKVAFLLPEQEDAREVFETNGWTVLTENDTYSKELFKGGATI